MRRAAWLLACGLVLMSAGMVLAHPPAILSDREEKATVEEVMAFRKFVGRAIETKDAAGLRMRPSEAQPGGNGPSTRAFT